MLHDGGLVAAAQAQKMLSGQKRSCGHTSWLRESRQARDRPPESSPVLPGAVTGAAGSDPFDCRPEGRQPGPGP